jgi:hypothetical protein
MKTYSFGRNPIRGSALLAALIVIVILTFAAAGVLSYSLTNYRNSVRQALLDQAKEVADSEMEYLYFSWKSALLARHPIPQVPSILTTTPPTSVVAALISTPLNAFSQNMQNWQVSRTLTYNAIQGTADGGAEGLVPGTVETGKNYFFTAETRATTYSPTGLFGKIEYHSGRHFVYSSTSLFQYAVFYQGNMEIAAGGDMTITGPMSTNASAYLGSQTGYTLTLSDKAYYFQDYNGATDPNSGETDRLQGSGALTDPVYNPNPADAAPANQVAQRSTQVVPLASQSSFVGGIDVATAIANYPAAYTNEQTGAVDPNEVYRAVIAPPPTDSTGALIPEDPVVASSRMYNGASIVITITQNAPGTPVGGTGGNVTVEVGTAADPNYYVDNNIITQTQADSFIGDTPVPAASPAGTQPIPGGQFRQPTVNKREAAHDGSSGVNVNLTTVDVGQLNNVLALVLPANPTTIGTTYNGLVYIQDNTNNGSVVGPNNAQTPINDPNTQNAILLTDGATTPAYNDSSGNPLGFSIASNNGIYVQGLYNTNQITVNGQLQNNPAAIMGDAVTAVSDHFTAANSGDDIAQRAAVPSPGDPTPSPNGGMTINAAILTGNTASTTTGGPTGDGFNSGGVQNLVRMEEDWWSSQLQLTLDGSLGQLFVSKYFTGPYVGNAFQSNINDNVYVQPKYRNVNFDSNFQQHAPSGTPTTTGFARGDFFYW